MMSVADPDEIPIFPLQTVVLYPTQSVPLYIFEPRYREMTAAALRGDRRIGMVAVRPDHVGEMKGDPPVFQVGCEGSIAQSERRPDGTYTILLSATRRFRIVEEPPRPPDRLYRVARVTGLEERLAGGETGSVEKVRDEVLELLTRLLGRITPEDAPQPSLERLRGVDDDHLVNALAQAIEFGVLEKQQLLEADGVAERYRALRDLMRFRLAELGTLGGSDPAAVH